MKNGIYVKRHSEVVLPRAYVMVIHVEITHLSWVLT